MPSPSSFDHTQIAAASYQLKVAWDNAQTIAKHVASLSTDQTTNKWGDQVGPDGFRIEYTDELSRLTDDVAALLADLYDLHIGMDKIDQSSTEVDDASAMAALQIQEVMPPPAAPQPPSTGPFSWPPPP